MNKRLLTFLMAMLFFSSFSQYKLDYDKDSKWFWDFNFGTTWHTTDVKTKFDGGFGFTVGKSFNFNYGKIFSFDVRARFLSGDWRGQNKTFTVLDSNYPNDGVYSNDKHNYKTQYGGVVENFETAVRRLSAELVIHLNAVRETSGWDPYIFGGIGYSWTRTKGDLIDSLGNMYAYSAGESYNFIKLAQMLDRKYESDLDNGFKQFTPTLMPSIGFGLGYQVSKRVSLGIEHKTTFTQDDIFDGVVKEGKYLQDMYHYTSGYIRFQIRSKKYEENNPTEETRVVQVQEEEVFTQPPVVTLYNPSTSRSVVNNQNFTINSKIQYVRTKENVTFKQEGLDVNTFSFNNNSKLFSRNVTLKEGENHFIIKGLNEYGADSVQFIIVYEKPVGVPPIVNITQPSQDFLTVNASNYNFKAIVENVTNKTQISLNLNGAIVSQFTYNTATRVVEANLVLVQGNNLITISATNEYGADSKTTAINYVVPTTPTRTPTTPSKPAPTTPTPRTPSGGTTPTPVRVPR